MGAESSVSDERSFTRLSPRAKSQLELSAGAGLCESIASAPLRMRHEMARSQGALATVKRESHPAYSAGWLPMCQLGGDTNDNSTVRDDRQRLDGRCLMPRIIATHWWRSDVKALAPGETS